MKVSIKEESKLLSGVVYNFDKPINVLVGSNGSGKSSLLKAITLSIKDDWELTNLVLPTNLIDIEDKPTEVSYYFVENDEKHKMTHFGDDLLSQVNNMKSSSGEATLNQVLRALTNKDSNLVVLDEPDSSLDITNTILLEKLLPIIVNKDKNKMIIMSIHSRSLLENLSLHDEVNIIDVLTGNLLDVKTYIKQQHLKVLRKMVGI